MRLRDDLEHLLRAWDAYETGRNCPPVVDFDLAPPDAPTPPAANRIEVYQRLTGLIDQAEASGQERLATRARCHLAYLRALLGERTPIDAYIRETQGCPAAGWPDDYVTAVGEQTRAAIDDLGIGWDAHLEAKLSDLEGPVDPDTVADRMRSTATDLEPAVRKLTGTTAPYELSVESVEIDAYWAYWLDGAGTKVRLRLNMRNARFTEVRLRQFALHEILGHGLQSASWTAAVTGVDVDWVRLTSVHAHQQFLSEGLAEALPLFVLPDDGALVARTRLTHYLHLVRAELHLAINTGASVTACISHVRQRVPWWPDDVLADLLTDRGTDVLLRSYLWSYPAGADWFTQLADSNDRDTIDHILPTAYTAPLTPDELAALWPAGPPPGGPGKPISLT